jgi:kinesin family protein 3/17
MEGYPEPASDRGIIPNSFKHIFEAISANSSPDKQFLVRASYLEIYQEVCAV